VPPGVALDVLGGVDGDFGVADQPGRGQRRRQGLTGQHQPAQMSECRRAGGVFLEFRQHRLQHGGHHLQNGDAVPVAALQQVARMPRHLIAVNMHLAAHQQRRQELPHRDV